MEFQRRLEQIKGYVKAGIENRSMKIGGERYLNNSEVCSLLNMNPRTLQIYRDTNRLGYIQISRKVLYKESDIIRILNDNYSPPLEE